jgi:hypothetical protein
MGTTQDYQFLHRPVDSQKPLHPYVMYATRSGHLYRSTDGVNWKLESDPNVPYVPEGTTRIDVL